jgi:hypothetical protein
MEAHNKTCFVISPIGEHGTPIRKRANQVLKYIITPCLKEYGYKEENIIRADKISKPGDITYQIIDQIVNADLVIADLTGRNPNVYYELAIRHALRKPYIQICDINESLPFDLQNLRTIKFDHTDLDSVEEAKQEIMKTLNTIETNPESVITPIHEGIQIENLMHSEMPVEKLLGNLFNVVNEIAEKVNKLEQKQRTVELAGESIDNFSYNDYKKNKDLLSSIVILPGENNIESYVIDLNKKSKNIDNKNNKFKINLEKDNKK